MNFYNNYFQKARDLELAAELGNSLLQENKELQEK
jgi:hypothetical protein